MNSLICFAFSSLFPLLSIVTLIFDHPKWKGFILLSWATSVLRLIKIHRSVWSLLCSLGYLSCDLDLWSLTSKIIGFILSSCEKCAIVFTRLFPFLCIITLTFDLWPPKSIGFMLSSWATFVLSLIKIHSTVWSLLSSQGFSVFCLLWPWPLTSDFQKQ